MQVNKTTPNNAKLINTGLKDQVTNEYIFQRISPEGKLYDSFISFTTNGTQKVLPKPNILRPSNPKTNHWTISDMKSGYYGLSNAFLANPAKYTQGGLDVIESYLPGVPAANAIGYGAAGISQFYGYEELYNDTKNIFNKLYK